MGSSKTICLCAIVKNEAKTLPRLIKSCKHVLDYWIIIDTGSTDNTKEIIHKELDGIPGEFYEREWLNFGYNRSELVSIAKDKADYLLLMDADMTINFKPSFSKNNLDADMYMIQYTGSIDFSQPLFVSGHRKWRYEGYTHEYITLTGKFIQKRYDGFTVNHHYDGGSRSDKYERDIYLCKKEIEDYPGRPRPHFYLAQTYQNLGKYQEAIKSYEQRIRMGGWSEEIYYSLFQIGTCLYILNDKDSAILQLFEAYDQRPTRHEALFMIGQIYRERKRYSAAKMIFEKIADMPYPKQDILFIHRPQKEYLVDFELGICYYWLGDYEKAEKHAGKVLKIKGVDEQIAKQNKQNYEYISNKLKLQKANKNDIIYVSMYTHGTPYEEEVKKLSNSFDRFGLFYEVVGIRPQGSWIKNTQKKPEVILTIMEKHNKDVVWVDADAEVLKNPKLFETIKCDISFHTLNWNKGTPDEFNEMLVGTVYFKNNSKVREFLQHWKNLNSRMNEPDGKTFQIMMNNSPHIIREELPASYVRIFDSQHMEGIEPVIIHNQASRRYKDAMNTGLNPDNLVYWLFKNKINGHESCSVIGNGPFESDLSNEIDASFVMRCNNFQVGKDYEKIGKHTDVNISSLYEPIIPTEKVGYPIFGILPISDYLYQPYTDAKQMHLHWNNNAMKVMARGNTVWTYTDKDDYAKLFTEIARKLNAFPTVGIMGIATARQLGFKRIILSGFTFFQSEKSHYFMDQVVRPSSHHNVDAERMLLKHWIENDDIEYVIDDLMMENIYQDETIKRNTT